MIDYKSKCPNCIRLGFFSPWPETPEKVCVQTAKVLWLQHLPHAHPQGGDWKVGESSVLYARDWFRHRHGGHLPMFPWHSPFPYLLPGPDLRSGRLSPPEDLGHSGVWPVWEQSEPNDWQIKAPTSWSLGWHNSEECPTRFPKNPVPAGVTDWLTPCYRAFLSFPLTLPCYLLGLSQMPPPLPGKPVLSDLFGEPSPRQGGAVG